MAYNTSNTPYTGYTEINEVFRRSGLDAWVQIEEHDGGLVYALYLNGLTIERFTSLDRLLCGIRSELGNYFMRQHFMISKLSKHDIDL
jgi:hypothetical protein